ncbi:MAG: DUF58 domain-containing protein [Aeromonadaceae bacterium]
MSDAIALSLEQLLKVPPLSQLLPSQRTSGLKMGLHHSASKGRGMEFAEVRPYLPGDDVRSIDWRITARTGKPHTKLFREERDRSVYVLLDLSAGMFFGSRGQLKARLATLIAASASWQALEQGDKVGGLILVGETLIRHQPGGRRKDLLHWLSRLLNAYQVGLSRPEERLRLDEMLALLSAHIRPGSLIHLISDFYQMNDDGWLWLRRLNKSHQIRAYQVYDGLEREVVGTGSLAIDNGKQQGFLLPTPESFVRHYRQIAKHRQHTIDRHLRETTQRAFSLDAAQPLRQGVSL